MLRIRIESQVGHFTSVTIEHLCLGKRMQTNASFAACGVAMLDGFP